MSPLLHLLTALQQTGLDGITEHTHRPALLDVLRGLSGEGITVTHEPKREGRLGAPDFKVTAFESIIGYVENKRVGEDLEKVLKSDQIQKYLSLSGNLLLTNYTDWIWVNNGEVVKKSQLFTEGDIKDRRAKLDKDKAAEVEKIIKAFLSQPPIAVSDTKKLAEALAIRARLLKNSLHEGLLDQDKGDHNGRLFQLYETFRGFVFGELGIGEFADAFAQTLVYGLFLAKLNAAIEKVNLYNAKRFIPLSFELIRELVHFLDELDNPEYKETRWVVEEVLTIMNHFDLATVQDTLSFTKKRKDAEGNVVIDPYIYFYEDFLAAYDKSLRKAKGVYYTPPAVVNFIVRAVDGILEDLFGLPEGLADTKRVTVLDFATGTGTFLLEVVQRMLDKLPPNSGKKDGLVREHILRNVYGLEYLIAPYTIAHLKLSQFLHDNGYEMQGKERLQVFLSNTLEPVDPQLRIPLLPALSSESRQAQSVKDKPVLVIVGNPPYSINSKNNSAWIKEKIQTYMYVDGQKIKERNPKGLQDDYVKFMRFAQDKMDRTDEGVVAIITNHTFLFNPTFPGMRKSLMESFDQLYFINLHGNSKMKEKALDGGKDENVFDIEQGVAISIMVKKKGLPKKVLYTDFWGSRKNKFASCLEQSLGSIDWTVLKPSAPLYIFQPSDEALKESYLKLWGLMDIFKINSSGIKTHKDHFAYSFELPEMEKRVMDFMDSAMSDRDIANKYNLKDTRDWKIKPNREKMFGLKDYKKNFQQCLYRPFDIRFTYFSETIMERPRKDIMLNIQMSNYALLSGRAGQVVGAGEWNLCFVTDKITDVNLFYRGGAVLFPLYILRNGVETMFFEEGGNQLREESVYKTKGGKEFFKEENFTDPFRKHIDALYGKRFSGEDILAYIYALLHSPSYRKEYAEFLKIDYPRIPFPQNESEFVRMAALGRELVGLHLMDGPTINALAKRYAFGEFIGIGTGIVEKIEFQQQGDWGNLYINKNQYFEHIPVSVYGFYVGGYRVLEKYLKDRKGRRLTLAEIDNIKKIVWALARTLELENTYPV